MTDIYCEQDGNRCILYAKGHATGSEQVCAAVSGIIFALAGYLANETSHAEIRNLSIESGDVRMEFYADEHALGAFETAVIGLAQIAEKYPEFAKIQILEQ